MLPEEFANISTSNNEFEKAMYELDYGLIETESEIEVMEWVDASEDLSDESA